ncbi:MAG: glycosyltransferase family 39 protein [Acidimicrobiales bacterium]|nr:glycosyltransferase family 39 protein [Acidimicrobiales bacterium]
MNSEATKKSRDSLYYVAVSVTAGIVLLNVFLRFFAGSPFWLDEAISSSIAEKGPGGLVDALRHDGHPPLYYLLLHWWSIIVGDSDFALRAMSGVFSVSSLFLIYWFTKRFTDKWSRLLVVGVLASSPFAIRYATEVRMYSLLVLLILIAHLLIDKAWRESTPRRLFAVSCVTSALLYTHYWSLFLVLSLCLVLLIGVLRGKDVIVQKSKKLLVAVIVGAASFLPWLPVFMEQLAHTGTPWSDAPRPTVVLALALESYGGGRGSEALLVAIAVVALATLGLFSRKQRLEEESVVVLGQTHHEFLKISAAIGVLAIILGVLVSLIFDSAFQGRYGVFAFIPLVLAVGVGLSQLPHRTGIVLLVVLSLISVVSVARELSRDRSQIGEIAASIEKNGVAGDSVVFCPDQLAPAAHRVLGNEFNLYAYPTLDSGDTVDWYDYELRNTNSDPSEVAERILSLHISEQSLWLVWVDGYKTFGSQCGELERVLAAFSSSSKVFVGANGDDFYNSANLTRFTK